MVRTKINTLVENWKKFDMSKATAEVIKDHEKEIILLNQDQMYKEGIMNVETLEKEKYSPDYVKIKKKKATFKETNHVTLRFFGPFYDSMMVLIFKNKVIISAKDLKWANWLEPNKRFGNSLGLTEKNKDKLREILRLQLITKIKNESTSYL